jgi:hypothetical protein
MSKLAKTVGKYAPACGIVSFCRRADRNPDVGRGRWVWRADELAKAARLLDLEVQEANWRVELC